MENTAVFSAYRLWDREIGKGKRMTYEEKMLEIFARYRGENMSEKLVAQINSACEEEVWSYLPSAILKSWKLKLALRLSLDDLVDILGVQI